MFGLRLGDKPQAVITTTPRPTRLIRQLVEDKNAIITRGTTFDNAHYLAAAFVERIAARYEGRTIGRQELFAEIVEEAPGALWTRALIERQRLAQGVKTAEYSEIVIGVDPPAKSGVSADECGIVVVGKTSQGAIHVLADLTSQGDTPGQWAARVGAAFRRFKANRIVAEINNGGEMVVEVLRQSDPNLPVRAVTATRGKFLRAEPVATAYERGIVHHLGYFEKLEDQLCTLTPDFDARASGFSPDRADALVWAIADLIALESAEPMLDYWAQSSRTP
jgi:phage terminase large subunit-like protein